jgi:hypothetical protein
MQRSVGNEFGNRISTLKNANAEDASGRLAAILTWLESEPVTRAALATLRASADGDKIFGKTRDQIARPAAYTTEEIAFVGLTFMEPNVGIHNADFKSLPGCWYRPRDANYASAGLHDYIYPLLGKSRLSDAAAEQTFNWGRLDAIGISLPPS